MVVESTAVRWERQMADKEIIFFTTFYSFTHLFELLVTNKRIYPITTADQINSEDINHLLALNQAKKWFSWV